MEAHAKTVKNRAGIDPQFRAVYPFGTDRVGLVKAMPSRTSYCTSFNVRNMVAAVGMERNYHE